MAPNGNGNNQNNQNNRSQAVVRPSRPRQRTQSAPVIQRTIVQRVVPKKKTTQRNPNYDLGNILSDIAGSFTSGLNKPLVLIALLGVLALVYTHNTTFSSGIVGKWVTANKATNNTAALWIDANKSKFLGLSIFVPALLDSPQKFQIMLSLGVLLWVMLIPQASIFEYVIQALGLHTYFKVKQQQTRVFIIVSVIIAYLGGFLTLPK